MSGIVSHFTTSFSGLQLSGMPWLENGDHLDRDTFHARYSLMPRHIRAELLDGIVHMMSPLKSDHAQAHSRLMWWLVQYASGCDGVSVADNGTTLLGMDTEVQPDASAFFSMERGGQARVNQDGYLEGPPELVAEVASSSVAYDLFEKKAIYERHGIAEYIVVTLYPEKILWFARVENHWQPVNADAGGVLHSRVLPGLCLLPAAFFQNDLKRLSKLLDENRP